MLKFTLGLFRNTGFAYEFEHVFRLVDHLFILIIYLNNSLYKFVFFIYYLQSLALQLYSGYKAPELKYCVLALHDLQLCKKGNSSQAVREKYTQHKVHQSPQADHTFTVATQFTHELHN